MAQETNTTSMTRDQMLCSIIQKLYTAGRLYLTDEEEDLLRRVLNGG